MSNLRNRVQLIGNLGMDPESVIFENDRKMIKFSLATSDVYYDNKGEKKEETQWHNIVCWGNTAEIAHKYLKKGSTIAVDGKLVYRTYEDKEGQKKYITEVIMNEMVMLSKKDA
jgi:single-strand DNA-binding protein